MSCPNFSDSDEAKESEEGEDEDDLTGGSHEDSESDTGQEYIVSKSN